MMHYYVHFSQFRDSPNLVRYAATRLLTHLRTFFETILRSRVQSLLCPPSRNTIVQLHKLLVTISISLYTQGSLRFILLSPLSSSLSFPSFAQRCGRRGRTRRYCRRLIASALLPPSLSSRPPTVHHDVTAISNPTAWRTCPPRCWQLWRQYSSSIVNHDVLRKIIVSMKNLLYSHHQSIVIKLISLRKLCLYSWRIENGDDFTRFSNNSTIPISENIIWIQRSMQTKTVRQNSLYQYYLL